MKYLDAFFINNFLSSFPAEPDQRWKSEYLVKLFLQELFGHTITLTINLFNDNICIDNFEYIINLYLANR